MPDQAATDSFPFDADDRQDVVDLLCECMEDPSDEANCLSAARAFLSADRSNIRREAGDGFPITAEARQTFVNAIRAVRKNSPDRRHRLAAARLQITAGRNDQLREKAAKAKEADDASKRQAEELAGEVEARAEEIFADLRANHPEYYEWLETEVFDQDLTPASPSPTAQPQETASRAPPG